MNYHRAHITVLGVFFVVFFWAVVSSSASDTGGGIGWQTLESEYIVVRFQKREHIEEFNNKIEYESGDWYLKKLVSGGGGFAMEDEVASKMDALFERVQELLDMKKNMEKVNINVYKNRQQLDGAYYSLYRKKGSLRAWYSFNRNTIFVNVEDLHEGMLAHELAHAVVDHYLQMRPPKATAEILARYVDKHIQD